jgi:peptide-methionine (S)-S-oxide reductase
VLDPAPAAPGAQTTVLADGCFWGVDAVFKRVKGVSKVVSGYAVGTAATADYETVGSGRTGHAESVQITFDPPRSPICVTRYFSAIPLPM